MPGPGGGARGGGGGFRGGGGGFGGRPHHGGGWHHHPPHHHGGWHHRPFFGGGWYHRPYYGGGGGCLGGMIGAILAPIIFLVVIVAFIFGSVDSSLTVVTQGGTLTYDENAFQDYADERYAAEFGESGAYEDNILLVVLTESENYSQYAYIAWVGDHVATDINYMFGSDGTELGAAMDAAINTNSYKYSLDSNLASVVAAMEKEIVEAGLPSSFTCTEERGGVSSHLTNRTELELTEETVDAALQSFTESTGIPLVVVVDDMDEVFERSMPTSALLVLGIGAVIVVVVIWAIVRAVRKNRTNADGTEPEQVE